MVADSCEIQYGRQLINSLIHSFINFVPKPQSSMLKMREARLTA